MFIPPLRYTAKPHENVMPMSLKLPRHFSTIVLTLLLVLSGTACQTTRSAGDNAQTPARNASTRAHATDDAEVSVNVRPGTQLQISVYVGGQKEIDVPSVRVSEAGTVTLPLIGTVRIAGRGLRAASHVIESLYGNYFVDPQVRLDIIRAGDSDTFAWGFVTVLGRVNQQGRVAIPPTRDLTVSSAIQQAGGFDSSARVTAIRVTRKSTDDGASQVFGVNMRNIGRRGKTDEDIQLRPNDVVFVPERIF